MGQGKRRFFTPEFKAHAIKLVIEGEHPISQIAGDLGIGESLLRRWRRENERLRQEREILKKAVAIVSEGPK